MMHEFVTVLNRTSQPVQGMWDGKPYMIKANAKVSLPVVVADAIKRQNVVMGSEDPYSGEMDYLVAILERNDPTDPVEQTKAITRMNRKPIAKPDEVAMQGRTGLYSLRDLSPAPSAENGPVSTSFGKD